MAKAGRKKKTISSEFRRYFQDHPEWLEAGSNEAIIEQWNRDHPRKQADERIRQICANLKSSLKRAERSGTPVAAAGRRGRLPTVAVGGALERLEESIDECLRSAKSLDRAGLDTVITHLRRARNEVVCRLGRK